MFLDAMINRASNSLVNYPDVTQYLVNERKFTPAELLKFRIGHTSIPFLPPTGDPEEKDFLEETKGLFFLKNKVLIPLENSMGLVNGVITRSMEKETKYRYRHYYLQEAKKIGAFFGLQQALPSIIKTGVVYVVEGAFDCITIARHYPNCVSTLTSFINDEQMYLLKMIADKIVLVFDPDEPGRKGVDIVKNKYGTKDIYSREFGHRDPNSYLVRYGDEKLKKTLDSVLGSVMFF